MTAGCELRQSAGCSRIASVESLAVTVGPLRRDSRIYVAGHRGLVGSAVWRHLDAQGFTNLIGAPSTDLDLRDDGAVDAFFTVHQPEVVVLAAARVGGIMANATRPADFLGDNLRIQVNVIEAAHRAGVDRLLFLGSSCIYPKFAPQPIPERALLTGILEPTNDAYAIAKIAGILHVQAMRRQHGHRWISAMPANLYGPGDSFDLAGSHVLPAMIRKFCEARSGGGPVTLWGSGAPRREFLHVDDLAAACLFLMEQYDGEEHVNVGTGRDVTVAELAGVVAEVVGYDGPVIWDVTKPDGTPRKLLDTSKITALGWRPTVGLREGIESTYAWFLQQQGAVRGVA
ncbi:MAG: GDP-L-fucose synthase family protein [Kineosporiaceae bacterium]